MTGTIAEFVPNVVQSLAFKYPRPRIIQARSGERAMFSLTDGRVVFWDMPVAEQIAALGVRVNEAVNVCLRWSGKKTDLKTWDFWLAPEGERTRAREENPEGFGEQPNGTFAVPKTARAAHSEPPTPSGGSQSINGNGSANSAPCNGNRSINAIREQTESLINLYADLCRYASEKHGDVVSRDDVRCLLMNRLISGGRR